MKALKRLEGDLPNSQQNSQSWLKVMEPCGMYQEGATNGGMCILHTPWHPVNLSAQIQ